MTHNLHKTFLLSFPLFPQQTRFRQSRSVARTQAIYHFEMLSLLPGKKGKSLLCCFADRRSKIEIEIEMEIKIGDE